MINKKYTLQIKDNKSLREKKKIERIFIHQKIRNNFNTKYNFILKLNYKYRFIIHKK